MYQLSNQEDYKAANRTEICLQYRYKSYLDQQS